MAGQWCRGLALTVGWPSAVCRLPAPPPVSASVVVPSVFCLLPAAVNVLDRCVCTPPHPSCTRQQDFVGLIEEMRVWKVARTASQIKEGMDADDGRGCVQVCCTTNNQSIVPSGCGQTAH